MTDLSQAYEALRAADAAGNTDDAKRLSDYISSQGSEPEKPTSPRGSLAGGYLETVGHVASGAIATPVAGIAGLLTGGDADVVEKVQKGLTYQPRTQVGKALSSAVEYPFKKLGEAGDVAGQKVSDVTGSPLLGSLANTTVQAAPAIIGKGLGRLRGGAVASEATSEAASRARTYVTQSVGIDWDKLPSALKAKLTEIAQDSTALDKLNPEAIKRQARLQQAGMPATKGQIGRDLEQITTEENLTKTKAGQPIRDVNAAQDERLHAMVDELRTATGAAAKTRQGVGTSVQSPLRAKYKYARAQASKAYDFANKIGENEVAPIDKLNDFLKDPINDANVGTDIRSRIKAYASADGKISLKHLEDIRQELTRNAKNPNKGGHYAGEAAKVIDSIMDEAGSSAYKNARSAWKAMDDEFKKQGRVKKLVSEKGFSTDRATALEDTLDHVLKSPAEDITKIKSSLLSKTGDAKIRAQGAQAWKDVQGGVLEYLREKATGRRQIPNEKNTAQFNSTFLDAFNELEADGKIDVIFDKPVAARLRALAKVVEDVRTKPSGRIGGSDTVPRTLNIIEKMIDTKAGGIIGAVKKVTEIGKEGRQAREAVRDPLTAPARTSVKGQKRQRTLRDLETFSPSLTLTQRNTVGDSE